MTALYTRFKFLSVRFLAPAMRLPALKDFYGKVLGFAVAEPGTDRIAFRLGETCCDFVANPGNPFYHFAFLVPGDRFEQAFAWAASRVALLASSSSNRVVFDFAPWGACSCYFLDPVGNIVELIAHRGVEESGSRGVFSVVELVGLSELRLVGDPVAMALSLANQLGFAHWWGTLDERGGLASVGEQARTLILCVPGRPGLPTGRLAEGHDLEAEVSGDAEGSSVLESARYRIRRQPEEAAR